jgi:uncharacterized membrane protein
MQRRYVIEIGVLLVVSLMPSRLIAELYSFEGLGIPLGSSGSSATAISADGSTIIGSTPDGPGAPFRWTPSSGFQPLPTSTLGSFAANAISGDGTIVAGAIINSGYSRAYVWSVSSGFAPLGPPVGNDIESVATAVSRDGALVVGTYTDEMGTSPFEGTTGGTFSLLGHGGAYDFYRIVPTAVSADGSVIVGEDTHGNIFPDPPPFGTSAFLYTQASGFVDLTGREAFSQASAINGPGSLIVGSAYGNASLLGPGQGLGSHPGAALGVSDDGATIVGQADGVAALWRYDNGPTPLYDFLMSNGVTGLAGWTLSAAVGVSADGLTIVGNGKDPQGNAEGWVAHIPEPSTLNLAALGGLALLAYRRRR